MIPSLPFGRTQHLSTRVIFGGYALAFCDQAAADRALDLLFEYGINHIDTAANYGDSELRIGAWMKRYRERFFLATKTQERTYAAARDQIRRSLERLQTDHLDLIQLHYLVDEGEWQMAMGAGGAFEAVIEAREAGLVRFIGVTGHDLAVVERHTQSLARFDFDSILLPYNYLLMQNAEYAAGFERSRRCAPSATSPCRPSRASHGACGSTARRATPASGTSRSASRRTSISPFTGC